MTNNLVPTPRTDRNGKIVIRHMRPEQQNAPQKAFPVVSLTTGPVDAREVRRDLFWVVGTNYKHGYSDTSTVKDMKQWLNNSTDKQIADLHTALKTVTDIESNDDPSRLREANVIRSILSSTLNDSSLARHAHKMLSMRNAFCSERSISTKADMRSAFPVYLGLVCNMHGAELREDEQLPPHELAAALQYTYEVIESKAIPIQNTPFNEVFVSKPTGRFRESVSLSLIQAKDPELMHLVTKNTERVEDIIEISINHRTGDPDRIKALLEHEGSKSLGSGAL